MCFFTKYHSSLPCSPDVRLRECVRRIFRPPAFIRRRSSSILRPYAHVRTAYGRRKEEKEEEGSFSEGGSAILPNPDSIMDGVFLMLVCGVRSIQLLPTKKRRKICADWYFWHFQFFRTKKSKENMGSLLQAMLLSKVPYALLLLLPPHFLFRTSMEKKR